MPVSLEYEDDRVKAEMNSDNWNENETKFKNK